MKKPLLLLVLLALTISAGAQTPYKVFGHKGKTLETKLEKGGGIIELINTDTTSDIGRLLFDFNNMKFTAYGWDNNEIASGEILPTVSKRWWSRDPKAAKYPGWSPYNMVLSNPINNIDPYGRDVFASGPDARETVAEMDKKSALILSIDPSTENDKQKKITGVIDPMVLLNRPWEIAPTDIELLKAINDKDIKVQLITTREVVFIDKNGNSQIDIHPIAIGGYLGSEIVPKSGMGIIANDAGKSNNLVISSQLFSYNISRQCQENLGSTIGMDAIHETLEAYKGAQIDPGGNFFTGYKLAHNAATALERNPPPIVSFAQNDNLVFENKVTKQRVTAIQRVTSRIVDFYNNYFNLEYRKFIDFNWYYSQKNY